MTAAFFKIWVRRPMGLGAIAPSGRALATAMVDGIHTARPGTIIELGGGTGSITRAILNAGVAPRDLIVIEREPDLCKVMSSRFPGVHIACADARQLNDVVRGAGVKRVAAIVSGLPLLCFSEDDCRRILQSSFQVLAADGEYIQFTYGPAQPVSQAICADLAINGTRSDWVLANLPPAFVWRYRRTGAAVS